MNVSRPSLLTISIVLTLLSALTAHGNETRPNLVFILCDDLGYGDVHCLNTEHGKIATPSADRLASEGIVFTNAHSGSSVCTPTRYGLLTGRYAWRSKLQKGVVQGFDDPLIAADRLTVGKLLQKRGYHTACIGKWHLNFNYRSATTGDLLKRNKQQPDRSAGVPLGTLIPDGPVTRGFDYYYGFHHARAMKTLVENDRVVDEIETIEMLPLLAKKSVQYIVEHAADARSGKKPFFLYVPLNSPHAPIEPSPAWQGKSGLGAYGDFVMETDWAAGEVIRAIDSNGLTDNTIVIFSSDNGCSKVADIPKLRSQGHYVSANLRGSKADIWDGGHRVPFIVRWPNGGVKATSTTDQLICLTDLIATCAELLGEELPVDAAEDSVSFLPALSGKPIDRARAAVIHHSISGKFAIRQGPWKLILCPGSGGWSSPKDEEARDKAMPEVQLYHMTDDIGEKNNRFQTDADQVQRLSKLLRTYVDSGRSTPGPQQTNDAAVDILKNTTKSP